jgi:hypothetical protein
LLPFLNLHKPLPLLPFLNLYQPLLSIQPVPQIPCLLATQLL